MAPLFVKGVCVRNAYVEELSWPERRIVRFTNIPYRSRTWLRSALRKSIVPGGIAFRSGVWSAELGISEAEEEASVGRGLTVAKYWASGELVQPTSTASAKTSL